MPSEDLLVSQERARALVASVEDLPTLPEVVIEITRLIESPDTTAEDVYKIVSLDISLSATMLKLVNSAFYGMPRQVTSLEKAIRILGFSTVRNIALAAFVFDSFLTGRHQSDYKAFWMHCIGVGTASGILARRLREPDAGEYFVYGLLHDLGVVLYVQYLPEMYLKVREEVGKGVEPDKAEYDVTGCTHRELGAALAERWDFPPPLVASILAHCTDPLPEEHARQIAVTTCADAIAAALSIGEALSPKVPTVADHVWKAAGVDRSQMGAIMDEVLAGMESSRSFINLLYK